MWPFNKPSDLDQPVRMSTATYLCRLMEEQNALLRDLVTTLGGKVSVGRTQRPQEAPRTVRTAADVTQVSQTERRAQAMEKARQEAEAQIAPHRIPGSGPASAPISPASVGTIPPTGQESNQAASPPTPLAPPRNAAM